MKNDWHNEQKVTNYTNTISNKMPGYEIFYELMNACLTAEYSSELRAEGLIIGGGGGKEVSLLQRSFPHIEITMLDQSDVMIQLAKKQVNPSANIQYIEADFMEVVLKRKYQIITACLVIHFIQDKEFFLQKVYNLLKKNGVFFLYTINLEENSSQEQYWRHFMLNNKVPEEDWNDLRQRYGKSYFPIRKQEMESILMKVGFTKTHSIYSAFHTQGWIIKK